MKVILISIAIALGIVALSIFACVYSNNSASKKENEEEFREALDRCNCNL